VSERLKEPASKAGSLPKAGSWVRIPPSPPFFLSVFSPGAKRAACGICCGALGAPWPARPNPTLSAIFPIGFLARSKAGSLRHLFAARWARRGRLVRIPPLRDITCPDLESTRRAATGSLLFLLLSPKTVPDLTVTDGGGAACELRQLPRRLGQISRVRVFPRRVVRWQNGGGFKDNSKRSSELDVKVR
jgi:hypothetical protein